MADKRPHPPVQPEPEAEPESTHTPEGAPSPDGESDGLTTDESLTVSARLAGLIRQATGLSARDPLPTLDDFIQGHVILGATPDLEWLISACCPGEEHVTLTLARLREHMTQLEQERSTATARFLEMSRKLAAAEQAGSVTLAQAAQMFYRAVYPEVREHLDIAVEQLGQPLERVILGVMGHYRDNLHGVDMSLVPDQLPQGAPTPQPAAVSAGATGLAQRTCPVCTAAFPPVRDKPNQLYCGEACGAFAYATQTWARNAARTPEMSSLPTPDPYASGIPPSALDVARAWQTGQLPRLQAEMARNQERQTGVRRVA